MKKGSFNNGMKRLVVMCALALAVALPIAGRGCESFDHPGIWRILPYYGRKYGRWRGRRHRLPAIAFSFMRRTEGATTAVIACMSSRGCGRADLMTAGIVTRDSDADIFSSCSTRELDRRLNSEQYKAFMKPTLRRDRGAARQDLAERPAAQAQATR